MTKKDATEEEVAEEENDNSEAGRATANTTEIIPRNDSFG
jgi:hypothetical protein